MRKRPSQARVDAFGSERKTPDRWWPDLAEAKEAQQ